MSSNLPSIPSPTNITELESFGRMAAASGYFRDAKEAAQAMVKIQTGLELGLQPMQALSNIHVVEGKPTLSSRLLSALLKRAGYDWRFVTHDNTACVLTIIDPRGRDRKPNISYTMEDARLAGLAGRGPWAKYPKAMLFARAISQASAFFAPEVSLGVYTHGELDDGVGEVEVAPAPVDVAEVVAPSPPKQIEAMDPPPPKQSEAWDLSTGGPYPKKDTPILPPSNGTDEAHFEAEVVEPGPHPSPGWNKANRRLMATLNDGSISRDSFKSMIGVDSLTEFNSEELARLHEIMAVWVTSTPNLDEATDLPTLKLIWLDIRAEIGRRPLGKLLFGSLDALKNDAKEALLGTP